MKKVLFLFAFCATVFSAQAQFKIGPNVAVPAGVYSDFLSIALGVDAYQMFGASEDAFLKFGVGAGFENYFGKNYDLAGQTFDGEGLPLLSLAAAIRFQIAGILTVGPDLGYAFFLKKDVGSGFYWRVVAGIDVADIVELNLFFHNVSEKIDLYDEDNTGNLGAIGLGALFEF